ncbi:GNAT family N-acetyltransferase [Pararcticibacter amylolyticus]|uniref:GNAT family N-acetyltransferase n=1 Tax=Pararcticibacter amylolyticus TaxID=2173175 RepID=A0A2U2PGR8_9SPHI|nr:GNAT family N-acetyltransferase [Pararcticibacter amylolyticus]PWG80608.1 GNAT family N-acetyltransferase [Pararcticibacter amylolyticus]
MLITEWVPDAYHDNENIVVRSATHADKEVLLQFEQDVIAAERPFDDTIKEGDINYYDIDAMINLPNIQLLVAELKGQLIASGYARIENASPYLKHRQYAYLGFMYVVPEHRGKGINKQIIGALQQWTLSMGVTELRLEVYEDNKPAIRAYEKLGFKALLLTMRKGS